ncbi:MAG: 6-carboxytetrahydropterin synthase QueD, partial [Syntrophomonas sp.]
LEELIIYGVKVIEEFAAAHRLEGYPGNCSQIHGHTWKTEVALVGDKLDELGMLVDFRDVRGVLKGIVGKFDHCLVNDVEPFNRVNPTAENLACFIFKEIKASFPHIRVKSVQVWESSTACAWYGENDE